MLTWITDKLLGTAGSAKLDSHQLVSSVSPVLRLVFQLFGAYNLELGSLKIRQNPL